MPYVRSGKTGVSAPYMKPRKRQRTSATTAAPKAMVTDAQLARVLNKRTAGFAGMELKFFDSSRTSAAISAPSNASSGELDPATLNCLNCPAQGDGEQNRDGRVITMKSINIKGLVSIAAQADQTAGDVTPSVFIALVLDTQTNGAQLNSEDVFDNPSSQTILAASPFRNLEYQQRFRILATHHISSQELAGAIQPVFDGTNIEQQGAQVPFSIYKDLKSMKVNFLTGQTSSVVSAIADNSLHVIAFCSNQSMAPALTYNARLRFMG